MEYPTFRGDERGVEGLEPDLVLPEQFFGALRRASTQSGERRLMAAVLEEGIETFRRYALTADPVGRELFDDARAWILARHDPSLFSFTTVCGLLEIDEGYLRSGLLRWLEHERARSVRQAEGQRSDPANDRDQPSAATG